MMPAPSTSTYQSPDFTESSRNSCQRLKSGGVAGAAAAASSANARDGAKSTSSNVGTATKRSSFTGGNLTTSGRVHAASASSPDTQGKPAQRAPRTSWSDRAGAGA